VRFHTVPVSKHQEFGSKLDNHISSLFEKQGPMFFVAAPSRENEQVVVCIWGWAKAEDVKQYLQVSHFSAFDYAADQVSIRATGLNSFRRQVRACATVSRNIKQN
jgi:quinol monooxygenase YgiN